VAAVAAVAVASDKERRHPRGRRQTNRREVRNNSRLI